MREKMMKLMLCIGVFTRAGAFQAMGAGNALEPWLTRDAGIKIGAGFGAGFLVAALLAVIWNMAKGTKNNRKKQKKDMTDPIETTVIMDPVPTQVSSGILQRAEPSRELPDPARGTVGTVHHIGQRKSQQDTFGINLTRAGYMAIVSDGMGGLADSEKVSQQAVMGMLQAGERLSSFTWENPLYEMLSEANEQVLDLLGEDQVYKSGATLLAILTRDSSFHWIAVGDSRIYLYTGGHLLQINREHIYKQQLLTEAVNRLTSFSRVTTDPQRDRLTSFLGMGEIKCIDGSLRPVDVKKGDKLLLMSDGIFNTISEQEIIRILETTANAAETAGLMERQVLAAGNAKQDNFTCVILDFS